jgi:DNA invertase Pin-like site-specific DNA recombinase
MSARKRLPVTDPKLAVAYIRVSKDEQNLGPEAQRMAIEGWAAREEVAIASWHEDHGLGGALDTDDRPGLGAALVALRQRGAGLLVVARRDRLARDAGMAIALEREAARAGARIVGADGAGNGEGPADVFVRRVIDASSEHERAIIRARTTAALDVKRKRGEKLGSAPFGGRGETKRGRLVPDDREQAVISAIVRLRRQGESEEQITRSLTELGHASRAGTPFGQKQIHRILVRIGDVRRLPAGRRTIRRVVLPMRAPVDVDLEEALGAWGFEGDRESLEQLYAWIDRGDVTLDVVSPSHLLPVGWEDRAQKLAAKMPDAGTPHASLVVAAASLLEHFGKTVAVGSSVAPCEGVQADVAATDGTVYALCGVTPAKSVALALRTNKTVLAFPHAVGARFDQEAYEKLVYWPDAPDARPAPTSALMRDRARLVRACASVRLLYQFKVRADLSYNPEREGWADAMKIAVETEPEAPARRPRRPKDAAAE